MAARDGGYFPIRVYAIDPEGIPEALRFPAAHPTTVEPSTTGPAKMLNEILDAIEGV